MGFKGLGGAQAFQYWVVQLFLNARQQHLLHARIKEKNIQLNIPELYIIGRTVKSGI